MHPSRTAPSRPWPGDPTALCAFRRAGEVCLAIILCTTCLTVAGADEPPGAPPPEPGSASTPGEPADGPGGEAEMVKQLTELSLEELTEVEVDTVHVASRHDQQISDAPASVTIITSDQIRKYGYRTLAEALASAPGTYVTYDRNYHYLGLRGFQPPGDYNSRFLLLVDGHRVNDNIYDSANIGTTFVLDPDLIDRVEFIRGPGSALYGSNAFFGVINVITRRGSSLRGTEVSVKAGSFDSYRARLTHGDTYFQDLEVLVSGTYYSSAGQTLFFRELDDPATHSGIARKNDGDLFYSLFGSASYKDLSLRTGFVWRDKELPTAPFETVFNSDETHTIDTQAFAVLEYATRFPGVLDLTARASYNDYYYRGEYEYDGPPLINKDTATGRWVGTELILSTAILPRNVVTGGLEVQYHLQQDQHNEDTSVHLDDTRTNLNFGLFLQDEIQILSNLSIVGGVRFDRYETFGETVNPRAGIVYRMFEPTTLKLLYGQAFRAPTVYELYYDDGEIANKPNPDLDPERIATYEAVVEQEVGERLSLSASVYHYDIKDLITQVVDPSDGLAQYQNAGEVEADGLEARMRLRLPRGASTRLSYGFQDARDADTRERLVNSPRHLVKLNLMAPLLEEKLLLGFEVRYTSGRKTLSGNRVNDFFLTNLTLFGQEVLEGLDISASVYNLFNHRYADPGGNEHVQDAIDQDGRSFWFQLTYRFR